MCVDEEQEAGMKTGLWMSDAAQGEQTAQAGGQERKGLSVEAGGDWSDRSVHVSSSIHHTVPLWFNQTTNVLTEFDYRSTGEWVFMQTPVSTCVCRTKISSNQMRRQASATEAYARSSLCVCKFLGAGYFVMAAL